jgi:hypothetical protein
MTHHRTPFLAAFAIIVATAIYLAMIGRNILSPSGAIMLWVGDPMSPEGSQQIADWYIFSHVIHGFLFFGLLWLVARRLPFGWRLAIATLIEAAWEITENSQFVIERYRSTTASTEYNGDSVLNVVCDLIAMAIGFFAASRLPVWATVALILAFEVMTMWVIRDGLALNILMLFYPVDAVRDWQQALWLAN